ncbi:MAG: response regulator transcription factor [Clostridia bacterium]|nr:response regulator transcription factor [Clostridia bacterium]
MDIINILVADDDREIAELAEIYLKNEGYNVFKAYSGIEALGILEYEDIHLVILDIMMPGMDGLETCKRIRENHNIPIIMLSAKSGDSDIIEGLQTGADDYVTKPFNPQELLARVNSQLRRFLKLNPNSGPSTEISVRGLTIDKINHQARLFGQPVSLTPIEFDIICLLMENQGKVFSTQEIFESIWKEKFFDSNNTVMVHIRNIRDKLGDNPRKPLFIKTVWGVGYKIEK